MSIQTISSYLVTRVQGLSGVNSNAVFDYENSTWEQWPSISITMADWKGKFLTNAQNERIYRFLIHIYQEADKENETPRVADDNLRQLADVIIADFDSNTRLGNTAIYVIPVAGKLAWLPDVPIRVMEVELEVHDVTSAS